MQVYLYLNEVSHADTWVNGGKVPIKLASTYKSSDRKGVMTPDECLIYKSEVPLGIFEPYIRVDGNVSGLTITGNIANGVMLPNVRNADRYTDDGLILSFSTKLSVDLARRLEKKACVCIKDVRPLKFHLEKQIGLKSRAQACIYTKSHERNHFLKSHEDSWQEEYRLFWSKADVEEIWVDIPSGLAEHIDLNNLG